MSEYATIVHASHRDLLGRRWSAAVVTGTIHSYYPKASHIRAWTAEGARRKGDREIRRTKKDKERAFQREMRARRATGYEESDR